MKRKRIMIFCIILLGMIILGSIKLYNYYKIKEMENRFFDDKNNYIKQNNIEVLQEYFYNKDDIIGWFFYKKNGEMFINIFHYAMINGNEESLVWKKLKIDMGDSIFNADNLQIYVTKVETNIVNIKYMNNNAKLGSFNINYEREGSCGEYTNRLFVKNTDNNNIIASSAIY